MTTAVSVLANVASFPLLSLSPPLFLSLGSKGRIPLPFPMPLSPGECVRLCNRRNKIITINIYPFRCRARSSFCAEINAEREKGGHEENRNFIKIVFLLNRDSSVIVIVFNQFSSLSSIKIMKKEAVLEHGASPNGVLGYQSTTRFASGSLDGALTQKM